MLSPTVVVVLAAVLLGETLALWLGRRAKVDVDRSVVAIVLAGALIARLAFVWQWRTAYLAAPGRPTVLNLWASWCPPCRREMPILREAQANYPDINFVFVNQGESAQQVHRYLEEQDLTLSNLLLDPQGQTAASLGQVAFPTTYLFNAAGRLIDVRVGELTAATLAERLARLTALEGSKKAGKRLPAQRLLSSSHR
ncbi:TlpA family protein disulfide reductase [Ensifer sp. 2YAB10]|uniref:TlpA family protein disulfide reductase n=1 Tax=Ensifer sp. 2YAB10 TaxID=3233021 RepID=UPI003F8DFF8E